eukprot:1141846-Pelagomonas_calceolata.AAC.1
MVSTDSYSNPLDFDPSYKNYFSANNHDQVFGACTDALSVRFSGYSFFHPPHDDEIILQLLRHALHSSIQNNSPVATSILLPHWRGSSGNACMNWPVQFPWINNCIGYIKVLAKFPARYMKLELPKYWFNAIPIPTHPTYPIQLIVVWNQQAREALLNANESWFEHLQHSIPEDQWLPLSLMPPLGT